MKTPDEVARHLISRAPWFKDGDFRCKRIMVGGVRLAQLKVRKCGGWDVKMNYASHGSVGAPSDPYPECEARGIKVLRDCLVKHLEDVRELMGAE